MCVGTHSQKWSLSLVQQNIFFRFFSPSDDLHTVCSMANPMQYTHYAFSLDVHSKEESSTHSFTFSILSRPSLPNEEKIPLICTQFDVLERRKRENHNRLTHTGVRHRHRDGVVVAMMKLMRQEGERRERLGSERELQINNCHSDGSSHSRSRTAAQQQQYISTRMRE